MNDRFDQDARRGDGTPEVEITSKRLDELIRWHGTDESALPPAHTLQHLSRDTVAALGELARDRETIARLRAAMARAFWAAERRELNAILLDALSPPPGLPEDQAPGGSRGGAGREASDARAASWKCSAPARTAVPARTRAASGGGATWRRGGGAVDLRDIAMERILEPEIMDDRDADAAYARADFSDSNQAFADRLAVELARVSAAGRERGTSRAAPNASAHASAPHGRSLRIVDLGCGPADVTIRIARKLPHARVTGVDGAEQMLRLAREAVRTAELTERIELHLGRVPGLDLPEHGFDAVVSKDMLHHLPDPHVLWSECMRLGRSGGLLQVMDLIRPSSPLEAREIVERVASREHPLLKEDFYHSLCAAFTPEEIRAQLAAAGLALGVERAGDRHWLVRGVLGGAGGVIGGADGVPGGAAGAGGAGRVPGGALTERG